MAAAASGRVRVGIGGWNYEPWHQTFYPPGLPVKDELRHLSRQLTMVEVNGTFYRTQQPSTFEKWRDETPDDFVFSLKAARYTTQRKVLAEAGASIQAFLGSGIDRLGDKLGPILWQLAPTKRYDEADFAAFVALLPDELNGRRLRHVLELRHETFLTPRMLETVRPRGIALVATDSGEHPSFTDLTADFVYLRLVRSAADCVTGYEPPVLDAWAACARAWASGMQPAGVPLIDAAAAPPVQARDVYLLMINGAKERAPRAALEVLDRLGGRSAA